MEEFGNIFRLPACFFQHFAGINRLCPAKMLGFVSKEIGEPAKIFAAGCRECRRPFTGHEGAMRRFHRTVDIGFCGLWNLGPSLSGCRIDAIKDTTVGGINPLAINQHFIARLNTHHSILPELRF